MTISPYVAEAAARAARIPSRTTAHVEHLVEARLVLERAAGWTAVAALGARHLASNALSYAEEDLREALAAISKAREALS